MKGASDDMAQPKRAGPIAFAARLTVALSGNAVRNLAQWCRAVASAPRAQLPPVPSWTIVAVIAVLFAVVASMFLIDAAATHWARHVPHWLKDAFEQITNLGLSGWFLYPFGLIILCLAALTSPALPSFAQRTLAALAARFGFLFLAIAAPGLFTTIIKRLIGRARPYLEIHDNPFTYMPFAWRSAYASLPSGHATTAASAAIAIGAVWPRARWAMWLYAIVIMFSRVVVLAHHPSDVIAGALVGFVGAEMVRRSFAARRLVFSPRDLCPYPGPTLRRIGAAARQSILGLRQNGEKG
jgi:membrane-associated phospholipid phosphatase